MDLLITNGLVVDGTGEPAYKADVAVKSGVIVAVGTNLVHHPGVRIVNAAGLIVTPGFVDIHTHYDGQVTWDPYLSPSTQHGVTTVLFGNCGVGFAPCKPHDRKRLIDILVSVEDIPGTALHEGIKWNWESFPEYLKALSGLSTACDFMTMIGHVPLRVYVMGSRSHEVPTKDDIKQIRLCVAEAVRCGAAGFSTSRTLMHRDLEGEVISGSYAGREELTQIFAGLAEGGGGIFEVLEDFADVEKEMDWLGKLSKAFGIPVSFALAARSPEDQMKLLRWMENINKDNLLVTAQSSAKTQGFPSFMNHLSTLPYDRMIAEMRRPEVKKKLLAEQSIFANAPFASVIFNPMNIFPLMSDSPYTVINRNSGSSSGGGGGHGAGGGAAVPRYERGRKTENFYAIAKARGLGEEPLSLIYDALVAGEVLWAPLGGDTNFDATLELLLHPHVKIGLGDGGAHLGLFQEAGCPTFMLAHYARDRPANKRIPLELAVKMQTSDTAAIVGLFDRVRNLFLETGEGVIAVGMKADINVINLGELNLLKPEMVADLPTGAKRWMQSATGYKMTILNGVPTYEDGKPTGALTGKLVRHPLQKHLKGCLRQIEEIDPSELAGPEPRSTNDVDALVSDAELVGGGSAVRRAFDANRALAITSVGKFLSGEILRAQDPPLPPKGADAIPSKL